MIIHQILLYDKITGGITEVEEFPAISTIDLEKRLLELQEGYCEGDEVPVVRERKVSSDGFLINTLIAESSCDFCYLSPIGHI